jgi:hypothetical protein
MSKLFEDPPLRRSAALQPTTTPGLLRLLHTNEASVEKQRVALREWLTYNDASPPLRISLRRNGYGILLDDTDELKGIPKPRLGPISRLALRSGP